MEPPRSAVQQKHKQVRMNFKICQQIKANLQQNNKCKISHSLRKMCLSRR